MKVIRFIAEGRQITGVVEEKGIITEIEGDIYAHFAKGANRYNLADVTLLPPCLPSKIICVGLNYRDHAAELNLPLPEEPVLFLKPPSTLLPHGGIINIPEMSKRVDYEGELALVIKKQVKNISEREALSAVFGYTCANDITARDLQATDAQWTRAKSFDTFLPLGPWIETEADPDDLRVTLLLNERVRQESTTRHLIFKVPFLVSYISRIMTLYPGDVVITGTPAGIGSLSSGDRVVVEIENIGRLENAVG